MYVIGGGEAVARTSGVPFYVTRSMRSCFRVHLAGIAGALAVARVGLQVPRLAPTCY